MKTYYSAKALTEDNWKYFSKQQKVLLLKQLGYSGESIEFAKYKSIKTVVKHGGGMIARSMLRLNQLYLKKNGGSLTITDRK